jgi:SAM-dependent methyltransferase
MSSLPTTSATRCPACHHGKLTTFYRLDDIPVHSCLLLPTGQEALDFPRAELELAVCPVCGFITNTRFDSRWTAYAPEYEDQQSFSPTFNRFAHSLAQRLIDRYSLHQKDIVEIGCGKGDFLRLLCKQGDNRGVGIDPSVAPDRLQDASDVRIQWVAEYFNHGHARFPADFICCRHTLEHIYEVSDFLHTLRQVIAGRRIPVVFEVPDSTRVLEECAFEDIYYEHCSYFTPGSLARLFGRNGFQVTDLYRAYDDQYLLIVAMPVDQEVGSVLPLEESPEKTVAAAKRFRIAIDAKRQAWQSVMGCGQRLVLWGSGSKCVSLLSSLDADTDSIRVVDINPYRHGKFIAGSGLEIMPPEFLLQFQPQQVIAMNRIYTGEIGEMLKQLGISTKLTAL